VHLTGVTLAVSRSSEEVAWDAIARARGAGVPVSFAVNHRPALGGAPERLREAMARSDVVFLSQEEAEIVGVPEAPEVILTRGSAGATLLAGAAEISVPGLRIDPLVDAAGAGDALAGAYLARRLAGAPPEAALRAGVIAASLSCRARGCARSYPTAAEVAAAGG